MTGKVHVIDNFLLLANSAEKCNHDLMALAALCKQIGVPLATIKTVGPSSSIPFLGIILDAVHMEVRLPDDKLEKARSLLLAFQSKQKVTLKELQSLIGVLNFACSVVVPSRVFLRRLIDLTMSVHKPHHHICLTRETKLDLGVWWEFLFIYGRSFLDKSFLSGEYLQLYTDAAGSIGYGALCGSEWFCGEWSVAWQLFNVVALELYPIMAAVHVWGEVWANKCLFFHGQ